MTTLIRSLLLCVTVLCTGGCPDTADSASGQCNSNGDCQEGQYCDPRGYCNFDCKSDADCLTGTCNSLGKCIGGGTDGGVRDVGQNIDSAEGDAGGNACVPFSGTIGKTCKANSDCGEGNLCLLVSTSTAICTTNCTPDDPATLRDEDSCPEKSRNRCGKVALKGGKTMNLCFRVCRPFIGCNECAPGIACDPIGAAVVGILGKAVCLYPGCTKNADCHVTTGTSCNTASNNCPKGQRCLPYVAGFSDGICVKDGACDTKSALCDKHNLGKATAKVGDPCKGDTDCGGKMKCYHEFDDAKYYKASGASCTSYKECCSRKCESGTCSSGDCTLKYRNGYCSIKGCRYAKTLTIRACPAGSLCNSTYTSGFCQRSCSLEKAGDCRNHAKDRFGDYECRAWNNLKLSTGPAAPGPVCDFNWGARCSLFKSSLLDCSLLGNTKNTTHMACRDLKNNKLSNSKDPMGFCLDDTASGPVLLSPDGGTAAN